MYKILIDIDSIRENPNAGKTSFLVPGRPSYSATVDDCGESKVIELSAFEFDELLSMDCYFWDHMPVLSIKQSRSVQRVYLATPEPAYLFVYMPQDVQCSDCGAVFDYTRLESDCCNCGSYTDERCPECGAWDCCEIEYEELEEQE